MPNSKIIEDVRSSLDQDPRITHAGAIAVSEQGGVVTLRGSVGSFRQRRAAVDITKSVDGVHSVEDELRVHLKERWDDDTLRGAALQMLIWDVDVPAERIEVSVADGWLTLKGEVKHQHESDAAFDDVSRLPGVGGITNEIKVITAGIDG